MSVSQPYVDAARNASRPFAVTERTGDEVRIHRFAHPRDAWAFFEEHSDDEDRAREAA